MHPLLAPAILAPPQPELILAGWDRVTPTQLLKNLANYRDWPFDGVALTLRSKTDASHTFDQAFTGAPWQAAEFEDEIKALETIAATPGHRLRSCYLTINANPGSLDWFDDTGWAKVTDKFRLAGQIVRRGKLAGIFFDPEPYDPKYRQFAYEGQSGVFHDITETRAKVKERARQTMTALASEAPRAKILSLYWLSDVVQGQDAAGSLVTARAQHYELLPDWAQGWLESKPATVTITDGNEGAYSFRQPEQFAEQWLKQRQLNPEGVRAGHGIYLGGLIASGAAAAGAVLDSALKFGDGTVWLWSEKGTILGRSGAPTWETLLPGLNLQLWSVRDPAEALKRMAPEKSGTEMLAESSAWSSWQSEISHGQLSREKSLALTSVQSGVWQRSLAAKPGQLVALSFRGSQSGPGMASVYVRFKSPAGAWMDGEPAERRFMMGSDGSGRGLVRVPSGAGSIAFLLSGHMPQGGKVTFQSLRVVVKP